MDQISVGRIVEVLEEEKGTISKGRHQGEQWRKKRFVLQETDGFKRKQLFELWNEHINTFSRFLPEEAAALAELPEVRVKFNIESYKMSSGKWFTTLRAFWLSEATQEAAAADNPTQSIEEIQQTLINQMGV